MLEFDIDPLVLKSLRARWKDEIELAIANAKRTAEDKRFRREFYRAGAQARRWWGRRWRARGTEAGTEGWTQEAFFREDDGVPGQA